MFFRRERPKTTSFADRLALLKQAGFAAEKLPEGPVKISKRGVGATIADVGDKPPEINRAGILVNGEIAVPLSGGYQMFLEAPSGKRFPATATQLKALHEFEEDVKEALGLTSLYNTSLGTTSQKHLYDRVQARDSGRKPRPWDRKNPDAQPHMAPPIGRE